MLFLCVAAALYLGVGIGVNRNKFGLRGVEAIPNIDFWRQLPGLIKDGITFSVGKATAAFEYVQQRWLTKG